MYQKSKSQTGINILLSVLILCMASLAWFFSRIGGQDEVKITHESDWKQVEKNTRTSFSEFGSFDFTNRIPGGVFVLQKNISSPWFLKRQFDKLGIASPDSVLVNYWKDKNGKPAGMLRQVQFIEVSVGEDTAVTFVCNEKTRLSFSEKYGSGIHNTMRAYADIYGSEIIFEQYFGQMKETTKFIRVGQQLITIKDVGNQMSEYVIKVNDKKIKSGTDDVLLLFNQDSIIAMLK